MHDARGMKEQDGTGEACSAYEAALRRLERREHASGELREYLKRKGFAEDEVESTLRRLIAERLLDDLRYARIISRYQTGRGKGPRYIQSRLREKGVRLELGRIQELIAETNGEPEVERARRIVTSRYPRAREDRKEAARAYQALLRRGFSFEVARAALSGPDVAGDG